MILTYNQLRAIVADGVIGPVPDEHINAASIDVTLGRYLWVEEPQGGVVDLASKGQLAMRRHDLVEMPYQLAPGEFVLAQTAELFSLPNNLAAEFKLKSSVARSGLAHLLAGWADPGWHGSVLTLELHNVTRHHRLVLRAGMKIGQMIFLHGEPVPDHASYAARGRYNGDTTAMPSKGVE